MPSKQLKDEVLEADFNAHIALGCESYFYIDDDGETWWSGVPKNLHNKLWGRQSSLPAVHYVELDACDAQNYFVSFAADDANWAGPKGLTKALQAGYDEGDDPVIVCFAPDDGWYEILHASVQFCSLHVLLELLVQYRLVTCPDVLHSSICSSRLCSYPDYLQAPVCSLLLVAYMFGLLLQVRAVGYRRESVGRHSPEASQSVERAAEFPSRSRVHQLWSHRP